MSGFLTESPVRFWLLAAVIAALSLARAFRAFPRARPPRDDTSSVKTETLQALGYQRVRILRCLGGERSGPNRFAPAAGDDPIEAFDRYVDDAKTRFGATTERTARWILAGARLLKGEIDAADTIVELLPAEPVVLDHGAGFCSVAPAHALAVVLPLPDSLGETSRWLAGSPEQAALREWLAEHRGKLQWNAAEGVYRLV